MLSYRFLEFEATTNIQKQFKCRKSNGGCHRDRLDRSECQDRNSQSGCTANR